MAAALSMVMVRAANGLVRRRAERDQDPRGKMDGNAINARQQARRRESDRAMQWRWKRIPNK
jgi:hypothetical protein